MLRKVKIRISSIRFKGHTFNPYMIKAGIPESIIMKITGHSTREMFDRYNSIDITDIYNAIDKFEVYLGSVRQKVRQAANMEQSNKKGGA